MILDSSITKLVYELPRELEKCQMRVETQPTAQFSFQKLSFDNSCQKTRKIGLYLSILIVQFYCISLLCAKYFVQDCRFYL